MKKKGIKKDLFIVSIITIVTITVWVFLDVFLTLQKTPVPPVTQKLTESLNPKLDTEVFDKLEEREFIRLNEENLNLIKVIVTETPEITPEIENQSTESANF